jgi:PAS domain S-box-containing protein
MVESATSVLFVDPDEEARTAVATSAADRQNLSVETVAELPATPTVLGHDGVLTEYDLGSDDGLDLVDALRAVGSEVPVVLLTDADPATFAERAFTVGVDCYVPKDRPNAVETALGRIERLVGEHRNDSELARRYERLLEQDVIGVYVIQDGALAYCNDRAAEMWNYEGPAEMIDRPVAEFIHPEYRESVRENVERVVQDDDVIQRRLVGLDAEGERVEIQVHSWRIEREGAPAVMGVCQDVTDRVERRRQLEAQNDRLETMASVISHDLRNPLNVATGYVDLLEADVDDERLDTVASALDRIDEITDDLLTMSRQSHRSLETEAVSLERAAHEAWQRVKTADAELSVAGDETIEADPNRLAHCLENLFANAVEHGGSDVTVSVEPLDDGFAVADTGDGIDPADREQIFEWGYTSVHQNTGLGTAIVASVADAHGWEVSVTESEAGGARFEFNGVGEAPA